jgi:hypothetical protein
MKLLGVDERIILNWIFKRSDLVMDFIDLSLLPQIKKQDVHLLCWYLPKYRASQYTTVTCNFPSFKTSPHTVQYLHQVCDS